MSRFSECQQLRVGACRTVGRFVEDTAEGSGVVVSLGHQSSELLVCPFGRVVQPSHRLFVCPAMHVFHDSMTAIIRLYYCHGGVRVVCREHTNPSSAAFHS